MKNLSTTLPSVLLGALLLSMSSLFCGSMKGQITRQYSSYFGGSGSDEILGVSTNNDGTTYSIGTTDSPNLGTTASAIQSSHQGGKDAFVSAVGPDGTLLWATYLGSTGTEEDAWAIAATPDDRFLYVAFSSNANSLPFIATTSEQPTNGGNKDVVLIKFRKNGTLVWATFLGGTGDEQPYRISVTQTGGILVSGKTESPNFPTEQEIQGTMVGASDGFVTKYAESGEILMSTFMGGSGAEVIYEACETSDQGIVLVGHTSTPFLNSPKRPYNNAGDLFVVSLSPTFTYTYGTYLGGNGAEDGTQWPGIAIDGEDRAYVVSSTTSSNYPVLSAIQATKAGGRDATISCLDEQGTLTWSTYFGGSADDEFTSITHHNGLLFLGGSTMSGSISHITTSTAFQASSGGSGDGMFAVMRTDGTVANASFYGGNGNDKIHDIDIRNGHLTFAGPAVGTNFPVFNATQSSSGGGTDGQLVLFDTDAFSAIIVNDVDASDCDANDGEITIELSSGELGTPPYDVSINNGFSFESSRSNLTANSSNQLSLTNIPWGTYVIKVRDAMGRQSRAGALQIKGCILLMCMESGENRLQLPEVVGATSYLWTTTAGTIDSGQGTRTIYINTTSMNTGDFGEVCVQAQGAGCDAPIVCVDIQKMCSREYCNNGVDDDGDNLVDCADEECPGANAAVRITQN